MRKIDGLAGCMLVATICVLRVLGDARTRENEGGSPTEELRSLMTAALATARDGDQAKLEEIARNLMIPNYEAWFKATFGELNGEKLATAYKADFERQEKWLPTLFESLSKQNGEVLVEDVREPRYSGVGNWCGRVLLRAAKGEPQFYRVTLQQAIHTGLNRLDNAGYFTKVEGAYRRLDCKALGLSSDSFAPPLPRPLNGPIRVGGNVQAARIIKKVAPLYPKDARTAHISGTVRLHVIIDTDGGVNQLEVISGHPLLQEAALDAVRQWIYQPTFLNGNPVEVDTTIDIIFTLNNPPRPNP
jgi:TonB family protein